MNKYLSKIIGAVASLAMVIGVGIGIAGNKNASRVDATEVPFDTCDFTSKSYFPSSSGYTGTWSYGDYTVEHGNNNGTINSHDNAWAYMKFGPKKAKAADDAKVDDSYIKSSQINSPITKVGIQIAASTVGDGGTTSSVTWGLGVYSDSGFSSQVDNVSLTALAYKTAGTYYLTPTNGDEWATNKYYKIQLHCTNNTTTNGLVWVEKVILYHNSDSTAYFVTYNANGGTGSMSDVDSPYASGSTVTVLDNEFAYAHHTFDHWNTAANDSGASYDPGDTFTLSANTTLYAQWTEIPTYTVTYHDTDKTSGNAPSDNKLYEEGDIISVKNNDGSLVRTGYDWYGWSLNENGSGTAYGPAFTDTYTMGASNIDFYPIWVAQPSIPSYDEELAFHFFGSTVSVGTSYIARSATVNSQTTSEYSSATWQITVGNSTAQFGTNGEEGNLSKSTLGNGEYAAADGLADALGIETTTQQYCAAICTTPMANIHEAEVLFSGTNRGTPTSAWILSSTNGTTWEVEARKVWNIVSGSKFAFVKNTDERQYAFVAFWNTGYAGGLKAFQLKLYCDFPEEQTITASNNSAYSDETITLTTNATTANWAITANTAGATLSTAGPSKTTVISASQEGSVTVQATADGYITASKTVSFTERPAGNIYDITFDSDGGSNSPESIHVEEGNTFVFPNPGTKEHYSFFGWSSDGNLFFDPDDTSPAVTADADYLGYWIEDEKYTVSYSADSNGYGSFDDGEYYASEYTLLPFNSLTGVTTGDGYRFKDYTVGGVHKNPGDTITLSEDVDVTVNFELIPQAYEFKFGATRNTNPAELTTSSFFTAYPMDGVTCSAISKVYGSNTCMLKMGSGKYSASITLAIPASRYITKVEVVLNDGTGLNLEVISGADDAEKESQEVDGSGTYLFDNNLASEKSNIVTISTSANGAIYLKNLNLYYREKISDVKTQASLAYSDYNDEGDGTFTYTDLGIRFGAVIDADLFESITIQEYGVFLSTAEFLDGDTIEEYYNACKNGHNTIDEAIADMCTGDYIKHFSSNNTRHTPKEKATPTKVEDNYVWMLYNRIPANALATEYVAVAYVKIDGRIIFLQEESASAKSLAYDLINVKHEYESDAVGGSLNYLATRP